MDEEDYVNLQPGMMVRLRSGESLSGPAGLVMPQPGQVLTIREIEWNAGRDWIRGPIMLKFLRFEEIVNPITSSKDDGPGEPAFNEELFELAL
jgi:hypothetical protein